VDFPDPLVLPDLAAPFELDFLFLDVACFPLVLVDFDLDVLALFLPVALFFEETLSFAPALNFVTALPFRPTVSELALPLSALLLETPLELPFAGDFEPVLETDLRLDDLPILPPFFEELGLDLDFRVLLATALALLPLVTPEASAPPDLKVLHESALR
jgi:hypothetical protein